MMVITTDALYLILGGALIAAASGTMYEAYDIEPADFVVNSTEQTNQFMCSVNAGRNGYPAFRISNVTGSCEMGDISANTMQNPNGIKVYVKSGITVQKCVISPTIAAHANSHNDVK